MEYYQVDLAVGEVIEDLGDRLYSDENRLVRFLHGSTEEPERREDTTSTLAPEYAECFESHDITANGETATATFTLKEDCTLTITFASYSKPGPGWDRSEADQQELIDYETREFSGGTHSLTVPVTHSSASANANTDPVVPIALLGAFAIGGFGAVAGRRKN